MQLKDTLLELFYQKPTLKSQLTLTAVMMVFWAVIFKIHCVIMYPYIKDSKAVKKRMKLVYKEYEAALKLLDPSTTEETVMSY